MEKYINPAGSIYIILNSSHSRMLQAYKIIFIKIYIYLNI